MSPVEPRIALSVKRLAVAALLLLAPGIVLSACQLVMIEELPAACFVALALCGLADAVRPRILGTIVVVVLAAVVSLIDLSEVAARVMTGQAIDVAFWYHANLDAVRYATWPQRFQLLGLGLWLAVTVIAFALLFRPRGNVLPTQERVSGAVGALVAAVVLLFIPSHEKDFVRFQMRLAMAERVKRLDPEGAAAAGIKLSDTGIHNLRVTGGGRNLVLIYLESFEAAFLDERLFPALAPNVQALRREAICFQNVVPDEAARFTFGALYSSLFGTHLIDAQLRGRINVGLNVEIGSSLISVPKILHTAGYRQTFVVGHSPEFSGLNVLLYGQGYDKIWSSETVDSGHGTWEWHEHVDRWGAYDRQLFEQAYSEFEALASTQAPFHLTVMTIDTHAPDGRIEPTGIEYPGWNRPGKQLLTAAHRTDLALGTFIEKLKRTAAWPNTTVFVMSDHLSWPCSLDSVLHSSQNRRMNMFALNAGAPRQIAVEGRTFDVAPTLLELLGIRTNYPFPLGESLLGAPSPRRLYEYSEEQQEYLKAYVLTRRSDYSAGGSLSVSVEDSPYASLKIGNILVPLTVNGGGGQAFPTGFEACGVRIDASGRLLGYERVDSPDALRRLTRTALDADAQVVVLGGAESMATELTGRNDLAHTEYSLLYQSKAATVLKVASRPQELSISNQEIAEAARRQKVAATAQDAQL